MTRPTELAELTPWQQCQMGRLGLVSRLIRQCLPELTGLTFRWSDGTCGRVNPRVKKLTHYPEPNYPNTATSSAARHDDRRSTSATTPATRLPR